MKRIALAVFIALVACGGSKTFTTQQAASILPGKADTPPGLTFLPDSSGEQPATQISKDQDQQDKLTSYGLEKGFASFYANQAAVTLLSQPTGQADPTAHVIAMLAETPDRVSGRDGRP